LGLVVVRSEAGALWRALQIDRKGNSGYLILCLWLVFLAGVVVTLDVGFD
jgi:hypothetical protein